MCVSHVDMIMHDFSTSCGRQHVSVRSISVPCARPLLCGQLVALPGGFQSALIRPNKAQALSNDAVFYSFINTSPHGIHL